MTADDENAPTDETSAEAFPEEASYPLLRRFVVLVLPVLALALVGLLVTATIALSTIVERAYQAEAGRRHAQIITSVAVRAPAAFAALSGGEAPTPGEAATVRAILGDVAREAGLSCAAVAASDGSSLLIGGASCPELDEGERGRIRRELQTSGTTLFREIDDPVTSWLVASVPSHDAEHPIVVATLVDAAAQKHVIGASTVAWVGGLATIFAAALGLAIVLVGRAQREIDRRTEALNSAHAALARFVSRHVRASARGGAHARRCETTVLFMDIRDFSSFADIVAPEEAAALVKTVGEIGFSAILKQGGDVDRLIGDGFVARFDGPHRDERAFAAAEEILARIAHARTPRGVGIGLIDGEVIEATIVAGDRADATILGRTVNLGARLCSAAGAGEIVATATMPAPVSRALAVIGTETLPLKGHRNPPCIRRYTLSPPPATPAPAA
ncbi:adenylate/guanylate cyclase domain-containing protein [Acuticoccus mangrovi]|uniref:Adenylate/guanylate cyclase domain-containing protein n=1 Tax=Acuticoccus mangrovi TaxID=2796142 RepID=A0A934IKU9_9HYPH|nr:adenylate/guanylate cyclase domain-containing protein [Acuticoccus mangrovi]MBJ3775652.1 adenylate/guanylate cyclase domain-containing protein [Acuticoccus mangrovi]